MLVEILAPEYGLFVQVVEDSHAILNEERGEFFDALTVLSREREGSVVVKLT